MSDDISLDKKPKKNWFKEGKSIFLIITAVLAFRSMLFEPFKIPTGSMIPTLSIGDFILVNKFSYGFKVPFSDWFSDPIYITNPTAPQRGDVIVFKYPNDESLNYIKRVVGVPGDTLMMVDKVLYINNKKVEVSKVDGKPYLDSMVDMYKNRKFDFLKTQTGEASHITQHEVGNDYAANFGPITVPENKFFVMGDNRDNSADSRFWGFVPFNNVKGKAILVWFSLNVPLPSSPPGDNWKLRLWKIGTLID
ncbi:MAG: signal peptidase I [Bacteriovoracaceae bacterium]|jgi:signal peptidase I|nr:signal peptidase I [Bacteriovoracaceae bacterium]